jgi:hypothetical protein
VREGSGQLVLREVEDRDLSVLFEHSTDRDAIRRPHSLRPIPMIDPNSTCGFRIVGEGRGFAHGRNEETDEVVLRLDV